MQLTTSKLTHNRFYEYNDFKTGGGATLSPVFILRGINR